MGEHTLKFFSKETCRRTQAAENNLRRSFDAEDARITALHAKWVMEALESGLAQPLKMADLDAAFAKGTKRAMHAGASSEGDL